jgi:hypothetical protein
MHSPRTATPKSGWRGADLPPPARDVHGLGLVDAVRIDVTPGQLPWLVDEIETVRYALEEDIEHQRRRDASPEANHQPCPPGVGETRPTLDALKRQLGILAMIREQLPIGDEAAKAAATSPWAQPADAVAPAGEDAAGRVAVVGPAALMTVIVRGALTYVAQQLSEGVADPGLDVDEQPDSTRGWRAGQLPLVSPTIADGLRSIAAATHAFTDTYLDLLAQQTYRFEPDAASARGRTRSSRS